MLLRAHFVQGTEVHLWLLPEPDVCGGEFLSLEMQCGILDSSAWMGTHLAKLQRRWLIRTLH